METNPFNEIRTRLNLASVNVPAIVGATIIIVMVAVLAGRMLIDTATASDFQISAQAEEADAVPSFAESAASALGESGSAQTIFVHVSGSVNAPGIYELDAGARVADAVNSAGGFTDDAATDSVNLARKLQDGEQIRVLGAADDAQATAQANPDGTGTGGTSETQVPAGRININTATAAELQSLPGIGPSTAAKIVADREAQGPFATVQDITRVSGIGDKKFDSIADMICV